LTKANSTLALVTHKRNLQ